MRKLAILCGLCLTLACTPPEPTAPNQPGAPGLTPAATATAGAPPTPLASPTPAATAKPVSQQDSTAIEALDIKAVKAVIKGDTETLGAMGTTHLRQLLAREGLEDSGLAVKSSKVLAQYRDRVSGDDPKERYPVPGSRDPKVLLTPFNDQLASLRLWEIPEGQLLSLSVFYPQEKGWKLQEVWAGLYSYRGWTGSDYVAAASQAIKQESWEAAAVYLAASSALRYSTKGVHFPFQSEYDKHFEQVTQKLDLLYPRRVKLRGGEVILYEVDGFTDERFEAHAIPIVYFVHPQSGGPHRQQMAVELHAHLVKEKNSVLLEEAPLVLYRGFPKLPVEKTSNFAATAIDAKTGKPYDPGKNPSPGK